MRTGMQIMARELRRANYHSSFMQCFGNPACLSSINIGGTATDITAYIDDINITDNGTSDCFWFWYDRPQACNQVGGCTQAQMLALQGAVTTEYVAAFRRDTNTDGVGTVQMTTTTTTAPNCAVDAGWTDITDPNVVDVLSLDVSDAGSICENLASGRVQLVEQIQVTMTARPVFDTSVASWLQGQFTDPGGGADSAIRELVEFINVRNNVIRAACP